MVLRSVRHRRQKTKATFLIVSDDFLRSHQFSSIANRGRHNAFLIHLIEQRAASFEAVGSREIPAANAFCALVDDHLPISFFDGEQKDSTLIEPTRSLEDRLSFVLWKNKFSRDEVTRRARWI